MPRVLGKRSKFLTASNEIKGKRSKTRRSSSSDRSSSPDSGRPPMSQRSAPPAAADDDDITDILVGWIRKGIPLERKLCEATNLIKGKPAIDELGYVPSDLGDYHVWAQYQAGEDPEFLCHRPRGAVPPVPLMLLYKPFSSFTTNFSQGPISEADLEFAEDLLPELHDPDFVSDHKNKVLRLTLNKLTPYLRHRVQPYANLLGGVEADGILYLGWTGVLYLEWKAESGRSGDPYFQALDYVRRAAREAPGYQTYALVVSISSSSLEVTAASVEGDDKVWAEPLAETRCYGDEMTTLKMARIWRAIRLFVEEVAQAGSLPRSPSPAVPWLLKGFTDVKRLFDDKLLFTYVNQGKREATKFVRADRYSEEAHRAWGAFAPELRSVEGVGADWKMVQMEYLSPEQGWVNAVEVVSDLRSSKVELEKLESCLCAAATAGHEKGYVHGDMRLCNIMIRAVGGHDYEVRFVDFDWAGKAGQALYPARLSRKVKWPQGARYGALIQESHDLYFVNNLLEQL